MCLRIKFNTKLKTAKIDLYVIKFLRQDYKGNIYSYYRSFKYNINKKYSLSPHLYNTYFKHKVLFVDHGFHSICSPKTEWGDVFDESELTFICKIPKGSKYYLGNKGDIVSNKLIFVEKAWEYSKYTSCGWVNSSYVFKKSFKILEQKYGKQNY